MSALPPSQPGQPDGSLAGERRPPPSATGTALPTSALRPIGPDETTLANAQAPRSRVSARERSTIITRLARLLPTHPRSSSATVADDSASPHPGYAQTQRLSRPEDHDQALANELNQLQPSLIHPDAMPRFAVVGRLGEGSQGVVYRVEDRDCRREVALKVLAADAAGAEDISRFILEAQITAQLEHPGIVPVHDLGMLPDGTFFYSMKRVDGQALSDLLAERAGKPEHRFRLLEIFLGVCQTIAFAHNRGVIHRDLKPRNIMVGEFGEVLVMDWGLAKIIGSDEDSHAVKSDRLEISGDAYRTMTGTAVGTPAYMSPEQASGEVDTLDPRCDVYSLGVLLYEMLCGASPYERGEVKRVLRQAREGSWAPLDQRMQGGAIPRRLVAIVHRAMALERDQRYPSVEDMAQDLRAFLSDQAVSAYRDTLAERCARWLYRNRRQVQVGALVAVIALCMGLFIWWEQDRRETLEVGRLRQQASEMETRGELAEARSCCQRILIMRADDALAREHLMRLDEQIVRRSEHETRAKNSTAADQAVLAARRGFEWSKQFSDQRDAKLVELSEVQSELQGGDDARLRARAERLEEEVLDLERTFARHQARAVGFLDTALGLDPKHAEAKRALCAYYVQLLASAEARGDLSGAAVAETKIRYYDADGLHADIVSGQARVTVGEGMPTITLQPLREAGDHTLKVGRNAVELTAASSITVAHGRYLAISEMGTHKALVLRRGQEHDCSLPPPPPLPRDAVHIPAGEVLDERGRVVATVPAFALMRTEVTCGQYLEFLNHPETLRAVDASRLAGALALVPRSGGQEPRALWEQDADGRFARLAGGGAILRDGPVSGISGRDAQAFAAWRAARDGQPWRLPSASEWLLAAQGGDGRPYPWGLRPEIGFTASGFNSQAGPMCPHAVGSQPGDRSVQGVFDLGGSLAEYTAPEPAPAQVEVPVKEALPPGTEAAPQDAALKEPLFAAYGGSFLDRRPEHFSCHYRRSLPAHAVGAGIGFRLALTLP